MYKQVSLQRKWSPEESFTLLTLERPLLRVGLRKEDILSQRALEPPSHHSNQRRTHGGDPDRQEGRQRPVSSRTFSHKIRNTNRLCSQEENNCIFNFSY